MSRRIVSSILACVLLVLLFTAAAFLPVPYVAMSPGPTINVLGNNSGRPIVRVHGRKTYPTKGQLRLVTVGITAPDQHLSLAQAMIAWFDGTKALYPRDVIYPPQQSVQDVQQEGSVEMVSSQDTAIAAALRTLGYKLPVQTEVLAVSKGSAADGLLQPRDRIVAVNGTPISNASGVSTAVQKVGVGGKARFTVRRDGKTKQFTVKTRPSPDDPKKGIVGIVVGEGYHFPFDVSVNIANDISGPSAGLIFSLSVYDTLTPGSLTRGNDVAGTGTISANGTVGAIGGVQQKIVGAADAGAKIFLVPPSNCGSALGADVKKGEIRLVKAPTLRSAITSIKAWDKNPHANLPKCG
jgi:PDZ domain-containing protein